MPAVLIVDDDDAIHASLALFLKQAGLLSDSTVTPAEALGKLEARHYDLLLLDMNFSRATTGEEGLAFLSQVRKTHPRLPVILMTAWGSIALAVRGMRAGASDFITKPWTHLQLEASIRTALELAAAPPEPEPHTLTRERLDARYDLSDIVGKDPRFLRVLDVISRVAATDASVLITGESGTGKELIAAALHKNSARKAGPFVKVNLGGIPSTLFESEMFGHVKGAFTDAQRDRKGRFELADGGTIFSMRSATSTPPPKSSSCVSCRTGRTRSWAPASRAPCGCGSSPPPTATSQTSYNRATSAKTFSIV